MVSYAWSGLGSSFGPVILLLVSWRGFNRWGAWAAMLVGSIGTIVWKNSAVLDAWISHRFAAFALALATGVLVASLTRSEILRNATPRN
jgi:sodium/proline symporter